MRIALLLGLGLGFVACSGAETAHVAPQQVYTATFRFTSEANLAMAVADPAGRIVDSTCRVEATQFFSETICSVVWSEPGNPGMLIFNIRGLGGGGLCEDSLRTGAAPRDVTVELWDGPRLRISAPMATALGGGCGYSVTTNNTF